MILFGRWSFTTYAIGVPTVPTPVGQLCIACEQEITEEDSGQIVPMDLGYGYTMARPLHRECMLLADLGHVYDICGCTNYEGMPLRDAAVELYMRLRLKPRGPQ